MKVFNYKIIYNNNDNNNSKIRYFFYFFAIAAVAAVACAKALTNDIWCGFGANFIIGSFSYAHCVSTHRLSHAPNPNLSSPRCRWLVINTLKGFLGSICGMFNAFWRDSLSREVNSRSSLSISLKAFMQALVVIGIELVERVERVSIILKYKCSYKII